MSKLVLPMEFRSKGNPFGYVHGQWNHEPIKHPGYDLNWGVGSWADLGRPLYAPADSLIVYAGKARGWGTLIVGLIAHRVDLPEGGTGWLGWRFGHPEKINVCVGDRVAAGEVVGTCGNGGNGTRKDPNAMLPHLHYDLFRREKLENYNGKGKPSWGYWDSVRLKRHKFADYYVDPKHYHDEIAEALDRVHTSNKK